MAGKTCTHAYGCAGAGGNFAVQALAQQHNSVGCLGYELWTLTEPLSSIQCQPKSSEGSASACISMAAVCHCSAAGCHEDALTPSATPAQARFSSSATHEAIAH